MKKSLFAIIFAALAIVACSKEEPAPAPAPAPVPAPVVEQAPAPAPAPAEMAPTQAAPAAETMPAAAALPAECEAYLTTVNACVEKLGAAGEAVKHDMEATRESWKQVSPEALGQVCKQATDMFEQQTAKTVGC